MYVSSQDTVTALDGITGARYWETGLGSDLGVNLALGADGLLYGGSDAIYALDKTTGTKKWELQGWSFQALGADGTIYGVITVPPTAGTRLGALQGLSGAGLANSPWPKYHADARNSGSLTAKPGPPVIFRLPAEVRVVEHTTALLEVGAYGTLPNYQWHFQGVPLLNATNLSLTLPETQCAHAGDYFVTVSNSLGVATSQVVRLVVGYGLSVTSEGCGTVTVEPELSVYEVGTRVELSALPTPGRSFLRWRGDASGSANPLTLTMDGHKKVIAEFACHEGETKWTSQISASFCVAIGADGTVYTGSGDRNVYALDGVTGQTKWKVPTDVFDWSSPAIGADGTVYVESKDHKVYALDGATGQKKWEFLTGGGWYSSPGIGADGTVYVGSADHKVYALDGTTGHKKWDFLTGSAVESSPAIGTDGTVYIGSDDQKVYALDGTTGHKKWDFLTGSAVESSSAIGADGTVYVGSFDQKVYALDGATGRKKWEYTTGGYVVSSPAIGADGTVYIGSCDNRLYALDGTTGRKKWQFLTGDLDRASPAIGADGTVYIGGDDNVYALDGVTGQEKWKFLTGSSVSSTPTLGPDGTLYVSSGGKLYALASSSVGGLANSAWPKYRGNVQNTGRVQVPAPALRFQSFQFSGNQLNLLIQGPASPSLWLDATTDFKTWTPLAHFTDTDGTILFRDPDSARWPQRFYRLRTP